MNGILIVVQIFWILLDLVCGSNWRFYCKNGSCVKENSQFSADGYVSLEICQLVCNEYLNIWPMPTGTVLSSKNLVNINAQKIVFYYAGPSKTVNYLEKITQYFDEQINDDELFNCKKNLYDLKVYLNPKSSDLKLTLSTDESYILKMQVQGNDLIANITGSSVFGVRHGVETLTQLLLHNIEEGSKCLSTVSEVSINDKPKYRHRGLLIDTARNYLNIDTIEKQINGMASSKLNVLHWHVTDSQSFPLDSSRLPNMTRYGAYSAKEIYTEEDVRHLTRFAKTRGVRILIEIDSPSHAGMGWQWGRDAGLGNLAVCVNKQPWRSFCVQPPCGQLNPINQNLPGVLTKLYKDIVENTPDWNMFHMGGDEVFIPCWNSTPEILEYLKGRPLTEATYLDLWSKYQEQNLASFDEAVGHKNTTIVVWTSTLTDPAVITKYLSKDRYIIQTWVPQNENDLITQLIFLGYKVIISTKDSWYLDHGFWGMTNYYKWKTVYENKMYDTYSDAILGGEVCMWGELVDDNNIDGKVWPRAAAAAERMWSDPPTNATVAQSRFFSHRSRLVNKNINADAVMPKWCIENEGECQNYR